MSKNTEFCSSCSKACSELALYCKGCKSFIHTSCSKLPLYQLQFYYNTSAMYNCPNCVKKLPNTLLFKDHTSYSKVSNKVDISLSSVKSPEPSIKHCSPINKSATNTVNEISLQYILTSPNSNPVTNSALTTNKVNHQETSITTKNQFQLLNQSENMDLVATEIANLITNMRHEPVNTSSSTSSDESQSSFLSCSPEQTKIISPPFLPRSPEQTKIISPSFSACFPEQTEKTSACSSEQTRITSSPSQISSTIADVSIIECGPISQIRLKNKNETVIEKNSLSSIEVSNEVNDSSFLPCAQRTPKRNISFNNNSAFLSKIISPLENCNSVSTPRSSQENIRSGQFTRKVHTSRILCSFYERNACKYVTTDEKCRFMHPEKCSKYIQFGPIAPNGCSLGETCNKYHPKLCQDSLINKNCSNYNCRAIHIKGTKRTFETNSQNKVPPMLNESHFLYNRIHALEAQLRSLIHQQWWRLLPPPPIAQLNQIK